MQPHRPQPHQHTYYPLRQSRGFGPPPSQHVRPPQQAPYQHVVQPSATSYVRPSQSYPQYDQQPGQYYPQPRGFTPHAQAAPPAPVPPNIHNHNQSPYASALPQAHQSYVPFIPFTQPPGVPPVRASSRSLDKSGRPLPSPAVGARQSPHTKSAEFINGHSPSVQQPYTQYTHANPPASSFSGHSFPQNSSFQTQAQVQPQTPSQSYNPIQIPFQPQAQLPAHRAPVSQASHNFSSPPSSITDSPPRSPIRTPSPSKRPLPEPPGGGSVVSPLSIPNRLVASVAGPSGIPAVASSGVAATGSSNQRRALPFSPTKSPNVEAARINEHRRIRQPQRSSTLPSPLTQDKAMDDRTASSGSKDDTEKSNISRASLVNGAPSASTQEFRNDGFALPSVQSKSSTGFALPQQQRQKPTQSLAFRLASLSLQEENSQKHPVNHPPRASPFPTAVSSNASSSSPVRSMINIDDAPPTSTILRPSVESNSPSNVPSNSHPRISVTTIGKQRDDEGGSKDHDASIPQFIDNSDAPSIAVSEPPSIAVSEPAAIVVSGPLSISVTAVPAINVSKTPSINISEDFTSDSGEGPSITVSEATPRITISDMPAMSSSTIPDIIVADLEGTLDTSKNKPAQNGKGLICYGCGNGILGRIVSAMGGRWHPTCFKCTVCSELLEHVSSYEHAGKPYCHLDYHEKFAPQCYHCRTPIIDERFITLDDSALGKRMYHEQHFFCAECGDPFLTPTIPGKEKGNETGMVAQDDDVGFTVYKGHPYCEACHVRLRYPKCTRCKKSIRDGMQAVEALGGKWCWECFLCAGCEKPFDDPAFFQRDNKPYCEPCFSVMIKSELIHVVCVAVLCQSILLEFQSSLIPIRSDIVAWPLRYVF